MIKNERAVGVDFFLREREDGRPFPERGRDGDGLDADGLGAGGLELFDGYERDTDGLDTGSLAPAEVRGLDWEPDEFLPVGGIELSPYMYYGLYCTGSLYTKEVDMQKTNKFIITTQPGVADTAIGELQKINGSVRTSEVFSPEVRMIEAGPSSSGDSAAGKIGSAVFTPLARVIFTRHIFPVQYSGEVSSPGWESVLPRSPAEFGGGSFSVQLRVLQRDEKLFSQAKAVLESAEDFLTSLGFKKDDKRPEWVVSLLINRGIIYAGASRWADNLSRWNGGEARYKKDDAFISRAEFKLLEAFDVFEINEPGTSALDLGAAPGGWSKALLDRGLTVTAVDPAEMHPSLAGHPALTHIPKVIQRCGFTNGSFDLLVNDMRMDIYDSARIMLDAARFLRPGAKAVMTLKLSPGHWLQKTGNVLKLLEERYRIINARQLFHNRDEVTAALEPR